MTQSVAERIAASREYLGAGTYKTLAPIITPYGLKLGWRYTGALGINLHGAKYTALAETLDTLEAKGIITLCERTETAF